ncbi:CBN-SRD-56 protein [Caenorhabditis brenneri]|uniref:CBN-SRD-56 protein n=1 Tax=Caenorhabditis brenneri TaxID=135651 RepID=G0PH75_CAEBE|nr:CBN-SRD-56 protein [Caenorhabditis brenneri]
MCTSSDCYNIFFNIYWIFYGFFGLFFQGTLVFLILRKLPVSIKNLKFYLINTACVQIALVLSSFSIQHRFLSNSTSLAILPAGPCKYFKPEICFANYHIAMIIPFTARWDFYSVQVATAFEHPTYNLTSYYPFPGFSDVKSFEFLSATLVIGLGGYGIPISCLVLTTKGLRLIKNNQQMADKTKEQARKLIHGLIVQSILPVIAYVPMVSSYIYTQTTGNEVLLSEYLTLVTSALPGLVDPAISCYFIIPFRHAVIDLFCQKRRPRDVIIINNHSSVAPT